MDAAQTILKKIAFFLAAALLLAAPFQASAQTLITGATSVSIGGCSQNQNVQLDSSNGANLAFSVAITYPSGNQFGDWVYASIPGSGSTTSSTPFSASTGTGSAGVALTIGLQSNSGIGTSSPSATVVLTPASGPVVNITVFYSLNTSCGGNTGSTSNGFLSVAPGNVALSAATNGSASQTLTIQNLTVSATTFGYSVSPSGSWLSVNATTTVLSASGTASLTVTANGNQTTGAGNYNGVVTITPAQGFGTTITINVVFTVTNGTGGGGGGGSTSGTLTLNGASSNTYTANFSYVAPNFPGDQCISLQDTASGADYYQAVVSTTTGGNWVLANNSLNGTTSGNLSPGSGACIDLRLSNTASSLPSGAYQGSVAITSSSGATATITVNLYVSAGIAPGITLGQGSLIYVFPNVAVNSNVVQQQAFALTGAPGYILGTASLTNSGNGFSMSSPIASNNTESFTVIANSTGLVTGIYATTVTMTSTLGSTTSTTTITIVLPVGQSTNGSGGGGTFNSVVAPASLAFQEQQNSSFWTGGQEAQAITITGQQGAQWSATIVYASGASGWLVFDSPSSGSGTFGNSPATLLVDVFNVTNLTPSSTAYQATIDITTPSGTSNVPVSLLVTQGNTPVLYAIPASATFAATTGTTTPSQTITVVGSDNLASTTSPSISAGTPTASWVSASTSGNTMTIGVNSTGQSSGVYSATIPVSAGAYANAINYPVVMIVNGGSGGSTSGSGPLTLSTTSMAFTGVTGQLSQNLNITATTSTQFTLTTSETNCTGNQWLQVTTGVYQATSNNTAITVTVFPSGISSGTTCSGVITLVSSGSNGGTQTVAVSMTVGSSTGSGNVTVSPTTMTFAYTQNQAIPSAQTATIVNAVSGTASISFTVGTTETSGTSTTWLQTNVTSAATPYNNPGLSVSVAPGNLSPGTYQGTVTITPTGGSAQTIAVTLTVSGSAVVTATPTTLSLSYTIGGNSPTGTIQVSAGGAAAGFTASVISGAGWLQVSPTSGTTPNSGTFNLTASIIASALGSLSPTGSPYTGAISIQGVSPASGTTNVNVTLTVTAPLPVISTVINAASGAGGPSNVFVSPGELISLFAPSSGANPIGPAASVQLNSTTCPSPCTSIPNTMGGVTVTFQPGGYLAPLLYVGAGQINAIVPYEVSRITGAGNLSMEVHFLGQTSNSFTLTVTNTQPGIFTLSGGTGQAAAIQYDSSGNFQGYNSVTPAKAGWILVIYLTGEGAVTPAAATGSVTAVSSTTPVPAFAPTVRIGNQPATLSFYGEFPGVVSGVLQINVIVPPGAGTGNVPLSVSLGPTSTQAGVTVSLQ